jgi:putative nucleotidyltransferase with HDIG domain
MNSLKKLKQLCSHLSVLYVEDDPHLRDLLSSYLQKFFVEVVTAEDGQSGLLAFRKKSFDLVITDIQMPHMNGIEMIEAIKAEVPDQEIIILTAFSESSFFMDAIRLDVSGYLIKPVDFENMNRTVLRIGKKIIAMQENKRYKQDLEKLVQEELAKNRILEDEKIFNYEQTLIALVQMIEKRDTYTGGHSERVAHYCKLIAQAMGFLPEEANFIYRAGILHDIGKIVTPDAILLKPGKLEENEYKLIQEHVTAGRKMLEKIPMYKELALIVGAHHERYDGQGYPNGLKGDAIPFLSRIMIVADAFDAMTTNRIYKPRLNHLDALEEIRTNSGKQFDPRIVAYALEALRNIEINTSNTQMPNGEIEQERFAYFYRDQVTGLYNQAYLDLILTQNANSKVYKSLHFMSIHNFGAFNQCYGWNEGDVLLKSIGAYLMKKYGTSLIFRFQGDDFIVLYYENMNIDILGMENFLALSEKKLFVSVEIFDIQEKQIYSLLEFEKLIVTSSLQLK